MAGKLELATSDAERMEIINSELSAYRSSLKRKQDVGVALSLPAIALLSGKEKFQNFEEVSVYLTFLRMRKMWKLEC